MVVEERPPGLRERLAAPDHVLADAGLRDVDTEFEQFAVDVRRAPKWVFAAQHADQFADLFGHCRAAALARANFPTPEQAEALALPADDRGGLEYGEPGLPAVPQGGKPDSEETISGGEFRSLDRALQNADLMAQGENLQLKLSAGTEEGSEIDEEGC